MQIFNKIEPLRAFLSQIKTSQKSIGLVPTMGALHPGHLSLITSSRAENQLTVGTIFVNPTQFNNPEDLKKYPRSLDQDIALLEKGECDVLFSPEISEMYSQTSTVKFDFGRLDKVLEGEFRPGHFSGVALVVSKLFHIIQPDRAYFGQKDYQQFAIVSRLVEELKFGIELRRIPTLREPDGLAMSSRNFRLNETERRKAVILYKSLTLGNQELRQGKTIGEVRLAIRKLWEKEGDVRLEYFELADRENLMLTDRVKEASPSVLLVAGYVGEVRLIDNLMVGEL